MKFLFDLDETLYVGDLVKVASEELIKEGHSPVICSLSGKDTVDFNFSNFPEILRQRLFQIFEDPIKACINKEPLPGAYPFLFYLQSMGHELGFATSRPRTLHEASKYVLWRDFPKIRWSFQGFSNNNGTHKEGISKKDLISTWNPDYYFDDYQGYCQEAIKVGIQRTFLISNSHTGWNHNYVKSLISCKDCMLPKVIKSILDIDVRSL